jgi:hypothetical protein
VPARVRQEPGENQVRRLRAGPRAETPAEALVTRDSTGNRAGRSDPEGLVVRHDDSLVRRVPGFESPMATGLVKLSAPPRAAECSHHRITAEVSRSLHPRASTSSRTR